MVFRYQLGTLNLYRAPFLDGKWVTDTARTISVNHFQLKLISEMFETFVILTNPHSFNKLLLCYLFSFYLHVWSCLTQSITRHHLLYYIFENLPWEFAARNCCGYLPREFAMGICQRNLPWLFPVRICRGYLPRVFCTCKQILFRICEKILFIWEQTFFICEQNFFICEIFFINGVPSGYFRGSFGPPCNGVVCEGPGYTSAL